MDAIYVTLAQQVHRERAAELARDVQQRSRAGTPPPPAARRRAWSSSLLRAETLLFLRDTPSAVFALVVPALVLVGAGLAVPGMRETVADPGSGWHGLPMIHVYTPAVLTMALATPALSTLPAIVASYREQGVLRRLSTTPTRPAAVLLAQVVINLSAFAVAAVLALLAGAAVFGSPAPRQLAVAALTLGLGAVSMFGIGLLVAARARRGSTAAGIGMLLYFPLLFLAGMWTPGPLMPDAVRAVASYTPVGATSQALGVSWFDDGFPALQLAVLVAWTALLYPLATRTFRWS